QPALPVERRRAAEQLRAGAWATLAAAMLCAAIVVGSRNLQNFDPALVVYTFATIFATWGIAYHYHVWIQKPPTRVYWRRGFQLVKERGVVTSVAGLVPLAFSHLLAQTFIGRRSRLRWWMHRPIFWGCVLGVAVTSPLVSGWFPSRPPPGDQPRYVTSLFGFPAGSFRLGTPLAWLLFHTLDVAAVLVLSGIALALWRR